MNVEKKLKSGSQEIEKINIYKQEIKTLERLLYQALCFIERDDIGEVHHYLGLYTSHELQEWWDKNREKYEHVKHSRRRNPSKNRKNN